MRVRYSYTGKQQPESCIFAELLNITTVCRKIIIIIIVRHHFHACLSTNRCSVYETICLSYTQTYNRLEY